MIRFEELRLNNFGPYKGDQRVEFPVDGGVVVIYGDNMRGKTSLLNAFRYTLYGKVLGRGSREYSLKKMENWEAAEEGDYGFETELSFRVGDTSYELSRSFDAPADWSGPEPEGSSYEEEVFLRRDGQTLSSHARERELGRIMPERVSRFFLFDGELLQQYEELVRDESKMGYRIKQAIERILGVPILESTRTHLRQLKEEAEESLSNAAQRNRKTEELGTQLQNAQDNRQHHQSEIEKIEERLSELKQTKEDLEEDLREIDKYSDLLEERDERKQEVGKIEDRVEELEVKLGEKLSTGWLAILEPKLRERRSKVREKLSSREEVSTQLRAARRRLSELEEALGREECPTCGRSIATDTAGNLASKKQDVEEEVDRLEEQVGEGSASLAELRAKRNWLDRAIDEADREDLVRLVEERENLLLERTEALDRISEIDEEFDTLDRSEVREVKGQYENTVKKIGNLEDALEDEEEKWTKADNAVERLNRKLEKLGDVGLREHKRRKGRYDDLHALFDQAVAEYRDKLRKDVERDATDLFLQLTTEPEYEGLEINENYGLTIVHESGSTIPVRSAGAEHVVALSLMGALQRNAPLRGPIVMDSPFGRLDEKHTKNVVGTLPNMAEQTVLLVFRSELSPDLVRDTLGSALYGEYEMERQSARHTKLSRV